MRTMTRPGPTSALALHQPSRLRRCAWKVSKPQARNQLIELRVATQRIEFRVKFEEWGKEFSLVQAFGERLDCLINFTHRDVGRRLDAFELVTTIYAAEGHELRKD